jgi:hypothetical protein
MVKKYSASCVWYTKWWELRPFLNYYSLSIFTCRVRMGMRDSKKCWKYEGHLECPPWTPICEKMFAHCEYRQESTLIQSQLCSTLFCMYESVILWWTGPPSWQNGWAMLREFTAVNAVKIEKNDKNREKLWYKGALVLSSQAISHLYPIIFKETRIIPGW